MEPGWLGQQSLKEIARDYKIMEFEARVLGRYRGKANLEAEGAPGCAEQAINEAS